MSQLMKSYVGGCQCGNIRYQINSKPLTLYTCHCMDCQKQSSSAFGMSLWVERDSFEIVCGELKFWSAQADDGSIKNCAFCSDCGTRIYHAFGHTEPLSVKGGSLDEIARFKPSAHIWTKRSHDWLEIERSGVPCYEGDPESFDCIVKSWIAE